MKLNWLTLIVFLFVWLMLVTAGGCGSGAHREENKTVQVPEPEALTDVWMSLLSQVVTITTYDGDRILETGQGFFADSNLVVTRLSLMGAATRAVITPHDGLAPLESKGYLALDRISDLIVLKAEGRKMKPLVLYMDSVPNAAKTYIVARPEGGTLQLRTGKVEAYTNKTGLPLYQVSNQILRHNYGVPIFLSNQQLLGIGFSDVVDYKQRSLVIPARLISDILQRAGREVKPLTGTRSLTDQRTAEANSRIRGVRITTDYGEIVIRLFNETPDYRDNFIRLAEEGFYDSLLVHRVIADLGIQSGAADTRYATRDDVVGWKGPGYTMPAHIVPGKFHQRGMVGAPRRPDIENARRRSEGSQYYIVAGRTYNDKELNDIEAETGHKFTARQREVYRTIGGAPHLDGSYTIFGEVVSGMEVVDEIRKVEVGREFRPLKDIRVRSVRVLR